MQPEFVLRDGLNVMAITGEAQYHAVAIRLDVKSVSRSKGDKNDLQQKSHLAMASSLLLLLLLLLLLRWSEQNPWSE